MCGIVGYTGYRETAEVLLTGLKRLEYRGYDSAGIAVLTEGKWKVIKAQGRLKNLENQLKQEGVPKGNCGIGHTRWATHGAPSVKNAHPHGNDRVMLVHNGIIENDTSWREKLKDKGYSFQTDTDTEVIACLLDYYYQGDPIDAIHKTVEKLQGSYALGILFADQKDTLYAVRKDSPLIVGVGRNESFIASDIPAILSYTRDYYLIESGEVAVLKGGQVEFRDWDHEILKKELQRASFDIEAAQRGGYPHFMLKEIYEQPQVVSAALAAYLKGDEIQMPFDHLQDHEIQSLSRIHIVACGTAMHAGMVGKSVIEKLTGIPVEVEIASEFRYKDPILDAHALVVVISQSGETADTLAALRLAKEKGVHTVGIVNVVGSSIAREADDVLYTHAGPEIAVASTKAYTVQLILLYLMALYIANIKESISKEEGKQMRDYLRLLPEKITEILENATQDIHRCAGHYQAAKNFFFIGRGIDYASSMEGSLKLKEISYIHSEAYASGELKHGTISLITDGIPVVAVATQKRLFAKTMSNVKEIKARGASVLLITGKECSAPPGEVDFCLCLPETDDLFMPVLTAVVLQLFAYYMAVSKGCDVDKPRNLAKSVTVE